MRGGLCCKQTCTVTVIHYCTDDRQLLIAQCISHRIAMCAYTTCIRRPRYGLWGVPVGILAWRLVRTDTEKREWFGYPTVKKNWRYDYSFWQNVRTWQTDRRTDGHRMTAQAAWQKATRVYALLHFWSDSENFLAKIFTKSRCTNDPHGISTYAFTCNASDASWLTGPKWLLVFCQIL